MHLQVFSIDGEFKFALGTADTDSNALITSDDMGEAKMFPTATFLILAGRENFETPPPSNATISRFSHEFAQCEQRSRVTDGSDQKVSISRKRHW